MEWEPVIIISVTYLLWVGKYYYVMLSQLGSGLLWGMDNIRVCNSSRPVTYFVTIQSNQLSNIDWKDAFSFQVLNQPNQVNQNLSHSLTK